MAKRPRLDLLSNLPLSIIHSILAFVPIRDAVKTSILSRKWRYILATLPYLVFNDECLSTCEEEEEDEDEEDQDDDEEDVESHETMLKNFINQALILHKGPIHKFELHVSCMKSRYIDQWLIFLSRNGIRMLILNASGGRDLCQIHSSIYSCEKLIHLELFNCVIPPPPPTFNGFLCLRSLVLDGVEVSCKAIESIVANSPLLEEFTLFRYFGSLELRIHAPNLKHLDVNGPYKEIFLSAPLLTKCSVILYIDGYTVEYVQQKSSACNYTSFFASCTNLEELSAGGYFTKYLSIGVESYRSSLVFHRLRVIELRSVSFNDIKQIWVVVRLIIGAPNLLKLKIQTIFVARYPLEIAGTSFWGSECVPNCTLERLKEVEVMGTGVGRLEMHLIKFLLESSPVLETLILKPRRHFDDHKLLIMAAELLRCRRASANAEIILDGHKFCSANV